MEWIGQSWEAKKTKKAAMPKARKAKVRKALTARDLMRFLFTGKRLDQGETERNKFFAIFLRVEKKADFTGNFRWERGG